jgi:DnaJ-class molecular chaperone
MESEYFVYKSVKCEKCDGIGYVKHSLAFRCPECKGAKKILKLVDIKKIMMNYVTWEDLNKLFKDVSLHLDKK